MAGELKRAFRDEAGASAVLYSLCGAAAVFAVFFGLHALGVPFDAIVDAVDGLITRGLALIGAGA